ncbi:hypothetical protein ACOSQ3_009969 [Xanthoceras sorbifolium]
MSVLSTLIRSRGFNDQENWLEDDSCEWRPQSNESAVGTHRPKHRCRDLIGDEGARLVTFESIFAYIV